jgi:hypothetical protein
MSPRLKQKCIDAVLVSMVVISVTGLVYLFFQAQR